MDFRRCLLLWLSAMGVGCDATEPLESGDAKTALVGGQDGGGVVGGDPTSHAPGASNAGSGQASDANAPGVATSPTDGGAAAPSGAMNVRNDAGVASDGAAARPDWAGLVTLDASITTGPDGAVISNDGGFRRYDPDAAGPILNAATQAACLMLANNICNRSADCQVSVLQVPSSRRDHLVESCLDTLLLNHNCNRAVSATSTFNTCSESVKTRDCTAVFASDFATACIDQITFQP